jgi:hypothetical protein
MFFHVPYHVRLFTRVSPYQVHFAAARLDRTWALMPRLPVRQPFMAAISIITL